MNKLTVIDFFCGAGGFSEGFRQKGFEIIKGYDNWQPAIDTYNYNYGLKLTTKNILDFQQSIEEINLVPNTDIIIGSPPCVSFSSSNKSGKADKSLGLNLTKCFLRVVAVKKHQKNSVLKAWYMENVANSIKYISEKYTFIDLNLEEWAKKNNLNPRSIALNLLDNTTIINSADYGSFQARKRAISGEIISKRKMIIPEKTHFEKIKSGFGAWRKLGELIEMMPSPFSKESEKYIVDPLYSDLKIKLNELTDHFYDSGLYQSEWRQSKELKTNHYCMGKMSFPENLEKPSRTITATKSGTSREALVYQTEIKRKGNGEYRSPTIREAASIMGFPYSYQFLGAINAKWRLVGNAVCPSVSRVLAEETLLQLEKKQLDKDDVQPLNLINEIGNLNNFKLKAFNNQPKRTKNSRFRRHPLKAGNITVTLSNYRINKNTKAENKWFTSIQYGTGINFKNQEVSDGFYKRIEPILIQNKNGKDFIKIINNGFSEKIGTSSMLQEMYETQVSSNNFLEPTLLVEKIKEIIDQLPIKNDSSFIQENNKYFKHKREVPFKQVFALYAINKITSKVNK